MNTSTEPARTFNVNGTKIYILMTDDEIASDLMENSYFNAVSSVFKRETLTEVQRSELDLASNTFANYAIFETIEDRNLSEEEVNMCSNASKLLYASTYKNLEDSEVSQLYTSLVGISKIVPKGTVSEARLMNSESGSAYQVLLPQN